MERYSHLQALPNSPLTPLTPLCENTSFNFNFGGDGSLDIYIDNVRQEHRVEQQQKKLLQQATRSYHKLGSPMQPKRYSEEFLKIRDVFECHGQDEHSSSTLSLMEAPNRYCCHHKEQQHQIYVPTTKAHTVKITHTGATPTLHISTSIQSTPARTIATSTQKMSDYVTTPTNIRTPLKQRNRNTILNIHSKSYQQQQKQKIHHKSLHQQQQRHHQAFRQASPVAARPLCPHVAKILHRNGLSMYTGLFQREEIDLYAFQLLKLQDLHEMGIKNPKHCELILADVFYVAKYY